MTTRAGRDLVVVRALVVAGLSLLLATAAHVTAGGLLPAAWALALMGLLCFAGSAMALDRRASRSRLALLLVGGQTTIHFAMTALAGHGDEGGLRATNVSGALQDAVHHLRVDAVADGPMMAAHLAAAGATGLALGHAERALWAVLGLIARAARFVVLVLRPFAVAVTTRPATHRPETDLPFLQARLLTGACVVRRGPPELLAAH
ncbi:hypothetical protein [Nocardioides phosphati]|uniref:hypothetical protein n=1 Tax=Nocardioides phosphati TaxID=1867775 RepID=UPI001668E3BE|nr:hypothetical protein [Nocardioides phosphati]